MATLPALGARRVAKPTRGIASVDTTAEARGMEAFGATVGRIADDLHKKQEQERDAQAVFAARRQLDDWERENLHDPQNGAVAKMGRDAFDLPEKIPKSFDEFTSKLGEGQMSPRARQAVQEMVISRRDQALRFVDRHAFTQRQVYEEGQVNADVDSSLNRAAMLVDAGDLATAKAETQLAATRAVGFLRSRGKSEEEIAAKVKDITSRAAVFTVNVLLEKDKPTEAEAYLKANAGSMKVEDLLRAQSAVGKAVDARQALVVASTVVERSLRPAIQPNDFNRLENLVGPPEAKPGTAPTAGAVVNPDLVKLVMHTESGGQRYGKDGKLLTSPKGAQGEMQVMPGTAKDPGYGVAPAKDNSPDELARVGRDYLAAMVREFKGNLPQALAAYNAGPGAVQDAMKKHGDGWLAKMPEETQAYVAKITKAYGEGGGAPAMPTLQSLQDQVRATIPPDQPQRRKMALDEVTRQYKEQIEAVKQQEEQATSRAYQWLSENGGDFARMPAGLRANLPPAKIDEAMRFAKTIAEGIPVKTDWQEYARLRAMALDQPAKFATMDLTLAFPKLGNSERETLLDLQAKVKNPDDLKDVATLSQQLSNTHDLMKWRGDGNAEKRGRFDQTVTNAIRAEEKRVGKKLDYDGRQKIIDRMLIEGEVVTGSWWRNDPDKRMFEVVGTEDEARFQVTVPKGEREKIEGALRRAGKPVTDETVRGLYLQKIGK